jgi:hypothetical protein
VTSKADFSAEEWTIVAEAPLQAGARVAAAEHGGAVHEKQAIRRVYAAARELRGESALLDDLVASPPEVDLQRMGVGAGNERLLAAVAILEAKATPEDVDTYKGFVLAVVQTVAEALREGGFLGIGGEEVSAREQAALDEIGAVLGQ